jgi:16S rRNA C967 or C1407 C5-methylase (RsmB/RsmF family)/NOL1/NOP2/fmu family ribosome biogenesis protein
MSNFPKTFLDQMQELFEVEELKAFFSSLETVSPVSLRYNPYKKTEMPTELEPVPWASRAFYLKERPNFTADPLIHAGAYYVQEASSMFLEQALKQHGKLERQLRVLDLCAAPGGKSTLISALLNEKSLLLSNEVIKSRAHILAENIQKWGQDNIWVSQNDPLEIGKVLPAFFDIIVVDAPCSGEGMFRKAEHSIGEWSLQAVQHCALRQQRILHDIWKALRPGGILIYSTCTYNVSENEKNLLKFKEDCDFKSLKIMCPKEWKITETNQDDLYAYRFYPHKSKGEGFFLSVLQKAGESAVTTPRVKKTNLNKAAKETEQLKNWCSDPDKYQLCQKNETIKVVPLHLWQEAQVLESLLNIVYGGAELAELNRKGFSPLPAAALWTGLNQGAFTCADLELETALTYLRQDNLPIDKAEQNDGWQLIRYKGLGLGWIKKLQNRVNNYFPKEWRIRMSMDKLKK